MNTSTRILIVDDEKAGRMLLGNLLQFADYELAYAADGEEAIVQARQFNPDIILLDVMMPKKDGMQVCRELRADATLAQVPILLITALDDNESRMQGIEAGADDFISKPYNRAELRARVRTIAQLNRQRHLLLERARFERLFEFSPDSLIILDDQFNIQQVNPMTCRLLNCPEESLLGQPLAPFVDPPSYELLYTKVCECFAASASARRCEVLFRSSAGALVPTECVIAHFVTDNQSAVQIAVRDISERRAAEEQIKRQLERLQALNTVGTTLTGNLDLTIMLNVVLEQITQQLCVDAADILLLNPASQRLEFAAGRGFRSDAFRYTRLKMGEGFAGTAALERRIINAPDLATSLNGLARSPMLPTENFVAYYAVPLIAKDEVKGVLEILNRSALAPTPDWLAFVENLAFQATLAINNADLFTQMQRLNLELVQAYDSTLLGWSRALDLRDRETENHTQRVVELIVQFARATGMSEAEIVHVRRGALLHDIGKMGVPDSILLKPDKLTDAERAIINQHPRKAYEMLAPIAFLQPALDIPYAHHERWDGTGYPRGLAGEAIPLAARLFAIVDVWDALRYDRPYRPALPREQVIEHLRSRAGNHFDPQLLQVFFQLLESDPTW